MREGEAGVDCLCVGDEERRGSSEEGSGGEEETEEEDDVLDGDEFPSTFSLITSVSFQTSSFFSLLISSLVSLLFSIVFTIFFSFSVAFIPSLSFPISSFSPPNGATGVNFLYQVSFLLLVSAPYFIFSFSFRTSFLLISKSSKRSTSHTAMTPGGEERREEREGKMVEEKGGETRGKEGKEMGKEEEKMRIVW
jgi:hypothetical protein